jgi:hypothetical protein
VTRPDAARLFAAMEATWPPAGTRRLGAAVLRDGRGGGSRVSAATAEAGFTPGDLDAAEAAMRDAEAAPLWQVRGSDAALDATLAARGYEVMDPVWLYVSPATPEAPPRVSAFAVWPPLAIQRDLWAEGGIGPERLAVMERVTGPKAALLSRSDDSPSGVGFVAVHDGIAVVHAVHVPTVDLAACRRKTNRMR